MWTFSKTSTVTLETQLSFKLAATSFHSASPFRKTSPRLMKGHMQTTQTGKAFRGHMAIFAIMLRLLLTAHGNSIILQSVTSLLWPRWTSMWIPKPRHNHDFASSFPYKSASSSAWDRGSEWEDSWNIMLQNRTTICICGASKVWRHRFLKDK